MLESLQDQAADVSIPNGSQEWWTRIQRALSPELDGLGPDLKRLWRTQRNLLYERENLWANRDRGDEQNCQGYDSDW